ncbi:RimJ/RimL family protein N-acetyltransferase [Neobacillus sp. B4I6]
MQLPFFVKEHFIETNEIVLAVNLQNTVAQGLYKKCGFIDEGERRMGNKGELIIMSYHL